MQAKIDELRRDLNELMSKKEKDAEKILRIRSLTHNVPLLKWFIPHFHGFIRRANIKFQDSVPLLQAVFDPQLPVSP